MVVVLLFTFGFVVVLVVFDEGVFVLILLLLFELIGFLAGTLPIVAVLFANIGL